MNKILSVSNIIGTEYEHRYRIGHFVIGNIDGLIKGSGYIIKGQFLSSTPKLGPHERNNAIDDLRQLIESEISWDGAQPVATSVLCPMSGYRLIAIFDKECPIVIKDIYQWKKDESGIKRLNPPQMCTRELEILADLNKVYQNLISNDPITTDHIAQFIENIPPDKKLF